MTEHDAGTDGYETEDYGTGTGPGQNAIVADRTRRSQYPVVVADPLPAAAAQPAPVRTAH